MLEKSVQHGNTKNVFITRVSSAETPINHVKFLQPKRIAQFYDFYAYFRSG